MAKEAFIGDNGVFPDPALAGASTTPEVDSRVLEIRRTLSEGVDDHFSQTEVNFLQVHVDNVGKPVTESYVISETLPGTRPQGVGATYRGLRRTVNEKISAIGLFINETRIPGEPLTHELVIKPPAPDESAPPEVTDWINPRRNYDLSVSRDPKDYFSPSLEDSPDLAAIKKALLEAKANFSQGELLVLQYHLDHYGQKSEKSAIVAVMTPSIPREQAIQRYSNSRVSINAKLQRRHSPVRIGSFPGEGQIKTHDLELLKEKEPEDISQVDPSYQESFDTELETAEDTETSEDPNEYADYQSHVQKIFQETMPRLAEEDKKVILKFGQGLAKAATTALKNHGQSAAGNNITNFPRDILSPDIPTGVDSQELKIAINGIETEEDQRAVLVQSALIAIDSALAMAENKSFGDGANFGLIQNCLSLGKQEIFGSQIIMLAVSHFQP